MCSHSAPCFTRWSPGRRRSTERVRPVFIAAILERDPLSVAGGNARVASGLERLILKCVSKDASRRWQSMSEPTAQSHDPRAWDLRRDKVALVGSGNRRTADTRRPLRRSTTTIQPVRIRSAGHFYFTIEDHRSNIWVADTIER